MERFRKLMGKVPPWLLTALMVALILWLTLSPHPTGPFDIQIFTGADKVAHAVLFGFLTFMALLDMMKYRNWQFLPLVVVASISIACGAFGIFIEFLQRAMGLGRSLEILDMLTDGAGAVLAGAIWAGIQEKIARPDDN